MKKMKNHKNTQSNLILLLSILKYLFSLSITVLAFLNIGNTGYLAAGLLELLVIFFISNMLAQKIIPGRIINSLLMLLYNVQFMVMIFGNSYISMLMLTNLTSIEALSGKTSIYIFSILMTLVFSFLPIRRFELKPQIEQAALALVLFLELGAVIVIGGTSFPLYSYYDLARQHYQTVKLTEEIENSIDTSAGDLPSGGIGAAVLNIIHGENRNTVLSYYKEDLEDYRTKDADLTDQPNIILIFTEGLSQNVISDQRNIMPNVAEYQDLSLSFTGYYNHTFATYRGLIGQLFSGYQLDNFDINPLVSLQSILSDQGYHTSFINTEPNSRDYTAYLENLGFEEIIGDTSYECNGMANSISDKDAYELLYDTAKKQAETETPFFIAIYTFGTHASLNSTDKLYGDGSDAELNKFYDADYQFGRFMRRFENSSFSDHTIIIYTTDHATYQDDSFNRAFPYYYREMTSLDEVPLFIYHNGIEPEEINVNGRNSLCLAPTILDYLDISAPNYFLGTSLFSAEADSILETSYNDSYVFYSSENSYISAMRGNELEEFQTMLKDYYITTRLAE